MKRSLEPTAGMEGRSKNAERGVVAPNYPWARAGTSKLPVYAARGRRMAIASEPTRSTAPRPLNIRFRGKFFGT